MPFKRRDVMKHFACGLIAHRMAAYGASHAASPEWRGASGETDEGGQSTFRYLLASSLYGRMELKSILPEVSKIGASAIDIWPMIHGNQREQIDEMGMDAFGELLKAHDVTLGCLTQYKLGPLNLQQEFPFAKRFGCKTIVTGSIGPKDLRGSELKHAVVQFIEQMKPHVDAAKESGITIAIENHSSSLISSEESLRYFTELNRSPNLAIAFAPYHLPQDAQLLAKLLNDVLASVRVFYAWQHGAGCMNAQPKEQELLQMPGRGELDFRPMIEVLTKQRYNGWFEIFMHPFPRGVAILDTADQVTKEINRARQHIEKITQAQHQ